MAQSDFNYIKLPYPEAEDLHFKILVPTCTLVIAPGIGNDWVTGRYSDPKLVAQLGVSVSGNTAQISTVGAFAYRTARRYLPDMRLSFGRLRPFSLSIMAGELSDRFDFGGLPLTGLDIKYGAKAQVIDFSYANPQTLCSMKILADAATINITNLANANAQEIRLNGDGTHYRLNFGGELQQSLGLNIGTSVASVEISVPSSTAVKISSRSALPANLTEDFTISDGFAWNGPAREQKEPLLTIYAPYASLRLTYL